MNDDDPLTLHGYRVEPEVVALRTGDLAAVGGVRLVELADGLERGIRALQFRTGTGLAFEVLVDRAMDIGMAEHSGRSFGWHSPTGFRHPALFEHADESGLAWLRSFSGLLVTAGLDHILFGGSFDAAQYHYPHRANVTHGLHGRIANIPAQLTAYGHEWRGGRCVLYAEGEMRQAAVFAEDLRLRRRIEADLGGNEIRLSDTVTNHGFDPTPHMFLYHINVGWPLLDEGTRVTGSFDGSLWESPSVAGQGAPADRIQGPMRGFFEQGWEKRVMPNATGGAEVTVHNPKLDMALRFAWSTTEFPYFFEWLNLRAGNYVLGLEPSTHHATGEAGARADSSMTFLEAGEARTYHTQFSLQLSSDR
jgi:hypothetical protein